MWTGEKLSLGDRGGRAAVAPPRPPTVKKDAARACVCNGDVISRVGYGKIHAVPHHAVSAAREVLRIYIEK